jgi:luciferase family oxidoreductase group 1
VSVPPSSLVIHDTSPISDGSTVAETLHRSADLARHGEELGFRRYWTAETHGMRAVASCSPVVVCGEIAGRTSSIRVGAGGVLLPHHSPLIVSEQFGLLEAFHPGRIDLAVGRGAGGPRAAKEAISPHGDHSLPAYSAQIDQLRGYFQNEYQDEVRSVTGYGHEPSLWLLGTKPETAELAATKRLPYAFGGHLNRDAIDVAVTAYRTCAGRPDDWAPYLAVSVGVIAADSHEEAEYLAGSHRMKVMSRKLRGARMLLPDPATVAACHPTDQDELHEFFEATAGFIIGDPATVRRELDDFQARTTADELIITTPVFDHAARLRSYEIVAGRA